MRKPKLVVSDYVTFPIKDFRGHSISFDENACATVKQLEGKRFLLSETPPLPLEDCDVTTCECSYVQYEDRRSADESRRKKFHARSDGGGIEKRRGEQDRRKSD
ncbi:MAG: hypothetical protein JKY67_09845 [Pseudomonadales bacterium]|nr:hypothetical protein [Pseudomonadales bacterium]